MTGKGGIRIGQVCTTFQPSRRGQLSEQLSIRNLLSRSRSPDPFNQDAYHEIPEICDQMQYISQTFHYTIDCVRYNL